MAVATATSFRAREAEICQSLSEFASVLVDGWGKACIYCCPHSPMRDELFCLIVHARSSVTNVLALIIAVLASVQKGGKTLAKN